MRTASRRWRGCRSSPRSLSERFSSGSMGDGMTSSNGHGNGKPLPFTKKDFSSDQETRWCPGCGDYAILATVQSLLPELGVPPERTVFVSGIGCAGRFVYYMDTYGVHGIHGRAPALATGLAVSR